MRETHPNKPYTVQVGGIRPFALRRTDMLRLLPSPQLIQRLIATTQLPEDERWLTLARPGRPGCELLVTTTSFEAACERMARGEQPPLLPCEVKRASQE
jgi:hypothetical protein